VKKSINIVSGTLRRTLSLALILVILHGVFPALAFEPRELANPFIEMDDELLIASQSMLSEGARKGHAENHPGERSSPESLGKTDRYIVEYIDGKRESFESKIATRLKESTDLSESMANIPTGAGRTNDSKPEDRPAINQAHSNIAVIVLTEPVSPSLFASQLKALGADRDISLIQPDFAVSLASLDGVGNNQMAADRYDRGLINMTPSGNSSSVNQVIVAVMDTGIDAGHDIFQGLLHPASTETATDSLSFAHGTHVSGTIAEVAMQTGADIQILPIPVFDLSYTYTSIIIQGIIYAESLGAKVMNCSFTGAVYNQALYNVIEASSAIFIVPAGNNRCSLDTSPSFPSVYDLVNVISVGSTNADDSFSFYSAFGQSVDLAARGRDVVSAMPGNRYGSLSGTSMSVAYVSGVAAAVLSHEDMPAATLRARLLYTSDNLTHLQNKVSGGRRINLENALTDTIGSTLVLNPANDFDMHGYHRTEEESFVLFSSLDIVQIEAGFYSSCALASDGTVWVWGAHSAVGYVANSPTYGLTPVQVLGLTDVISVSLTEYGGIALKGDGSIWEWGYTYWYNLIIPRQLPAPDGVVAIASGDMHWLALDSSGRAWSWGVNYFGQLSRINNNQCIHLIEEYPVLIENTSDIVAIAAGAKSSYFLDNNGDVWAAGGRDYCPIWGYWDYWHLLADYLYNGVFPMKYDSISGISDISAGGIYGFAYDGNGDVWRLPGYEPNMHIMQPAEPLGLAGALSADSCGDDYGWSCFRAIASDNSGNVWVTDEMDDPLVFSQKHGISGITSVSTDLMHSLALDSNGKVWSWGENGYGQLGDGTTTSRDTPALVSAPPGLTSITVTLTDCIVETGDFDTVMVEATALDEKGAAITGVQWSLDPAYPTGVYINQNGEINVTPFAQSGTVEVCAAYKGIVGTATLTITTPPTDGTMDNHWKFIRLFTEGIQHELSTCYYFDQKTYVHNVYNPGSIATVLRFTMQYGQDVMIGVYEVSREVTLEKLLTGQRVGPRGGNPDEPGPKLGPFVGWLTTGTHDGNDYNVEDVYDDTTPYEAKGYNGPLWPKGTQRPDPLPFFDPDEEENQNIIKWDGYVTHDTDGTFRIGQKPGEEIEEGHIYAIVVMPLDDRTDKYPSYLGIAVDYDEDIGGLLGAGKYLNEYGNIIGDPLNIINGNFTWSYTDIEVFGAEPLSWSRTYNSQDKRGNGPLGHNWRHSYQFQIVERPLTAQVIFPDGATLTYNKTYSGGFEKPIGTDYELIKTQNGFKLSGKDKTVYEFNNSGNILLYTNSDGLATTFTYSGNNLTGITNNSGTLTIDYYGNGRIYSVTDGTDKTVYYDYDDAGDLTVATNPDGDTLVYTYDSRHNMLTIEDFEGNVYLENIYDEMDRIRVQTVAGHGTSYMDYDPENRKSTFTDARGLTTVYYYDENMMLTSTEDMESGFTNEFYPNGRLKSRTDRTGHTTSYEYDQAGNMTRIDYPDGTYETYVYNYSFNKPLQFRARDGGVFTSGKR